MTQNMAVEQKRPSALPGMLIGGTAGAAAGWGLSKIDALKKPKYSSFEDILKDSKDIFEAAKKDGASDDVKNIATNVRQNISKFYKDVKPTIDAVKDGMTTEKTALAEAKTKFKDLWSKGVDDIVEQIKKGDVKIEGLDAATADNNEIVNKARKYLREHMTDDLKDAQGKLKEAANKLKFGNLKFTDEQNKTIGEKAKEAWNAIDDKVKNIKTPRTGLMLAGGAALGIILGLLLKPKAKKEEA